MLKYRHMQKKKNNKLSFNLVLFFVPLLILIGSVVFFTTVLLKNSELILYVVPSSATIKLDGHKIKNGSRSIRAGSHELEISGDGLETKTIEFEVAKKQSKSISAYVKSDNGSFDYYLNHEEDIAALELITDDAAKSFVEDYYHNKTILELLPITIAHEHGDITSTLSEGHECTRSYCLKITDDNAELRAEMEAKIKELGYNPEDYEIQYERTNSLGGK